MLVYFCALHFRYVFTYLLKVLLSIPFDKLPWLKEWQTKSEEKFKRKKPLMLICESTVKNKIAFSSVAKTTWAKLQIFQRYRWNLPGNLSSIPICQIIQGTIFILSISINMAIFMVILAIFIMEIITIIMAIEHYVLQIKLLKVLDTSCHVYNL